ncbi:MAG: chorismate synthase [Bacteroidales bacterium]|nr:chorismate synthase [Bacteroidales bacterium]
MMNSFGQIFRLTDFGETHGKCVGGVIDGCPSGLFVDVEFVQSELDRRVPHKGDPISSQRAENDCVEFLSGIYEGKTTGAPIAFIVQNQDGKPNWENNRLLKPSHASFVLKEKFGHQCNEQGGRFSARQTVCRVVAGAIAKLILKRQNIDIHSETISIAQVPDDGDTAGALVECRMVNLPAGLGEPAYGGFDAMLAAAILSIPACKGFEIGEGFAAATMRGSRYNDLQTAGFQFLANHDGGVQAGITNGQPVVFRAAFKPIPSLRSQQQTIDYEGNPSVLNGSCRNDRCVCPRVLPIVEAMAALVTVDALFLQLKNKII